MPDIFIYLFKVSAGLGIIFLPYYFLFRKDPNLNIKRIYLVSGVVAAWIFPFITFRKIPLAVDLTPTVFIDLDTPLAAYPLLESTATSTGLSINWLQILLLVYLSGLAFLFLKNLFIVFKWNLTWQRTRKEDGVAFINSDQVFSLFTRIFIPGSLKDEQDLDHVLLHEQAHIRQLHFIDLMIMELTLLLTWFNPFSWLISRMIKENHEHLADRQVLSAGVNPARYRAQLMNHTLGVNVFRLGNQFNHSLTLNRFKMMKKPKRSLWGILKITMLIPAVLVTLGLTTGMTAQQKTITGKVVFADTGIPATGASVVVRNGTLGCVVDREGAFMLNVDGDPELVISFVGYESLIVKASEVGKKSLKLEVKTYTMDLEPTALEVKKNDSGTITLRTKDGATEENEFYIVEEMPTFNGGEAGVEFRKYIARTLQYPKSAAENGVSGHVIVQFMVNQSGKVVDPLVVRSVDPALDKEALRVVNSSPKWTPGKHKGKTVDVMFTFPFNFVLNDAEKSASLVLKKKDGSEANPVYVVDGEVVDDIESMDPETIESISVYKDSDNELVKKFNAKDGLIVISTKEGAKLLPPKEGKKVAEESAANNDEPVFYTVEDMPKFPGGKPALKSYIYSNLEYPKKETEGEAVVRFLVNEKGKVVNSEVLRSSNPVLDDAALKVVREMPDWTPGKQRGKAVKVWYVMSINFDGTKK